MFSRPSILVHVQFSQSFNCFESAWIHHGTYYIFFASKTKPQILYNSPIYHSVHKRPPFTPQNVYGKLNFLLICSSLEIKQKTFWNGVHTYFLAIQCFIRSMLKCSLNSFYIFHGQSVNLAAGSHLNMLLDLQHCMLLFECISFLLDQYSVRFIHWHWIRAHADRMGVE